MIKITTYNPDGTTTYVTWEYWRNVTSNQKKFSAHRSNQKSFSEEDFIPETIYKVLALVNDDVCKLEIV